MSALLVGGAVSALAFIAGAALGFVAGRVLCEGRILELEDELDGLHLFRARALGDAAPMLDFSDAADRERK